PFANRTIRGPSIVDGGPRDVEYLVQICDPCAAGEYRIGGVLVSDFSLPGFWTRSPKDKKKGKYSFTGLLRQPFQIARGGYLSWRDPTSKHWWQKVWWAARPEIRDLGAMASDDGGATESGAAKSAGVAHARTIRFRLTALREMYRVQEPQLDSARAAVESLIRRFS